MASRQINLPDFGTVLLTKRKNSRNLRLSVDHNGQLRVSLPHWASYKTGLDFAKSKSEWILKRQQALRPSLISGQAIGKAHHLRFTADPSAIKVSHRLTQTEALVRFPTELSADHPHVQSAAIAVSNKALRAEAEQLLPIRLKQLAQRYSLEYNSVRVRQLKSRWGSCNSKGDITLNFFLMQLPWRLIDYVLLHELIHTKVMRHGPPFWGEFRRHLPEARALSREVSRYNPNFNSIT